MDKRKYKDIKGNYETSLYMRYVSFMYHEITLSHYLFYLLLITINFGDVKKTR